MTRAPLILTLVLAPVLVMPGCTKGLSLITGLVGGGPKVAANVQAGKTNAQTIGQAHFADQRMIRPQARTIEQSSGETQVRADTVRRVVVNEAPPWLIILALALWALPTPTTITRTIWGALTRKKGRA